MDEQHEQHHQAVAVDQPAEEEEQGLRGRAAGRVEAQARVAAGQVRASVSLGPHSAHCKCLQPATRLPHRCPTCILDAPHMRARRPRFFSHPKQPLAGGGGGRAASVMPHRLVPILATPNPSATPSQKRQSAAKHSSTMPVPQVQVGRPVSARLQAGKWTLRQSRCRKSCLSGRAAAPPWEATHCAIDGKHVQ